MRKGLLIINLGTPSALTVPAVRAFLSEFLLDPDVVDLPWLVRQVLVRGFILPFRPKRVIEGYRQIWDTERGSPLRWHTEALTEALSHALGPDWAGCAFAMRYGAPGITGALKKFSNMDEIWILPLYPQYAQSTWGSVESAVATAYRAIGSKARLHYVRPFYAHPSFIQALNDLCQPFLQHNKTPETHWLMTFHGLPERQVRKTCAKPCAGSLGCPILENKLALQCYRAQCWQTARLLAERLGLDDTCYTVAFQSRLGRTPWIKPYADEALPLLRERGVKNLVVVAPSFVIDCLETLEELGIRMQESWHELGGSNFFRVPSLNSAPQWVNILANELIK